MCAMKPSNCYQSRKAIVFFFSMTPQLSRSPIAFYSARLPVTSIYCLLLSFLGYLIVAIATRQSHGLGMLLFNNGKIILYTQNLWKESPASMLWSNIKSKSQMKGKQLFTGAIMQTRPSFQSIKCSY